MGQNNKLHIAQVAHLWSAVPPESYGGGERRVHLLTEELVKRGHEVTLYAAGDSTTTARLSAIYPRNLIAAMEESEAYHYDYYLHAQVAEVLNASSAFDISHFHLGASIVPFSLGSKSKVLHTIPTCVTVDDIWTLNRYKDVPVSGISHQQLAEIPERRRQTMPVVHNGCDFDAYSLNEEPGEYLAFLGRMVEHKGPLDAIRIAQTLERPIILAGEPLTLEDLEFFNAKIAPHIDGTNVIYLGAVNDQEKNDMFNRTAALLFPIHWEEPFGYVMIEAMACGVPVVALKRGSVAEVVDQGVTGYYTEAPEDLPTLVNKAVRLDRKAIREFARTRFSYQRMVDEYLEIYTSLVER